MTEETKKPKDWFWNIFGGTVIGLIGLLLGTILSNLSGQIMTMRTEISGIAEKVAASQGRNENYKDRLAELESSLKSTKDALSQLELFKESYKEKMETLNKMTDMSKETDKEIKAELKALSDKISAEKPKPVQ